MFNMSVQCGCLYPNESTFCDPLEMGDFTEEVGGRGYVWECPKCKRHICIRLELMDGE
jgi:hypothetical protein